MSEEGNPDTPAEGFRHPVVIAIVTFLLTGVGANLFQNWLASRSKSRDLELASSQRAADSVKVVTELIFERAFRANMLVSSVKRLASREEITERKKAYDAAFINYNTKIQVNIFRIREIFVGREYTTFKGLLQGPLRDLLRAQDQCVTTVYDAAVSSDEKKRNSAKELLTPCELQNSGLPGKSNYSSIYDKILLCEYTFSDTLFQAAERYKVDPITVEDIDKRVTSACQYPQNDSSPNASTNPAEKLR